MFHNELIIEIYNKIQLKMLSQSLNMEICDKFRTRG